MTTYRAIAASETDPDAPLVAALMKAVADNPKAITEGAVGAPRVAIGALERLTAGTAIRSRDDTTASTSSSSYVTEFSFDFAQSGTVRVTFSQRSTGGSQSDAQILRTRNRVSTALFTWSTTSTSFQARTGDVGVLPGDLIAIQQKTAPAGTAVEVTLMRIQTNGESLWPGSNLAVEGNTFL